MESPPYPLVQAVSRETADARVLWSGGPYPWGYARTRFGSLWAGVPFTAFAVFWTWAVSTGLSGKRVKHAPPFMVWWGLGFVAIGLLMLLQPVFALWKAGRVFYVVTEKGALIFEKTLFSVKVRSFDASDFNGFERVSRGSNSGDIIFQRLIERRDRGTSVRETGFIGLRDYSEAEQALRAMMAARKTAV